VDGLIPDGPLHPVDAAWALGVGLVLGFLVRRHPQRSQAVIVAGVVALLGLRPSVGAVDAFRRHPDPAPAVVLALVAVGLAALLPMRPRVTVAAAAVACGPVWALVPDTEVPLLVGLSLAVVWPWVGDTRPQRLGGLVVVLPLVAAVAGTLGRPARLAPSVVAAGAAALAVGSAWVLVGRWRQRAGTPTTVAPAGTSSTTTAPAPTVAS
jgi:hypothetical protein